MRIIKECFCHITVTCILNSARHSSKTGGNKVAVMTELSLFLILRFFCVLCARR